MKANTIFIFAGIMSAVIGNAYATGENIVTSKSYVDNTFQTKVTAGTTGSVVTYNGTQNGQAQFSERAIYDDWELDPIDYPNDLATAGVVLAAFDELDNTKQSKMTCAGWPESVPVNQRTDANCWLWNNNF